MSGAQPKDVEAGQAALAQGRWQDARERFEAALASRESPEAREGLGWALWWTDEVERSFQEREAAYRGYSERGDSLSAARVATALAIDVYDYRGAAVTNGWIQRARRHLEGREETAEHGWLALWEGHLARFTRGDVATTRRCAERAAAIGRKLGLNDLKMLAVGLEGYALVSEGDVDEGMRRLDEATAAALSGEISDLDAAGAACCFLMHACEQVRDLDRAAQWADRVAEFSRRWRIRPLYAICRVHYAAVRVGRGEWEQADKDLREVVEELSDSHGPARQEAVLHLAELRRRQGRFKDAERLFDEVEGYSLALLGRGIMALQAGEPRHAVPLLDRSLRRAAEDNWTVRSTALKHLARAQVMLGKHDDAKGTLETLQGIADLVRTHYVRATARWATGCWLAERGESEAARQAFEDAVDLFDRSPAPFETHSARLDFARVLHAADHVDPARREAEIALEGFRRLGATREMERAAELLASLAPAGRGAGNDGPLTRRETEILALVAEGLGDREMAARLHVSEHTVHRHVSNVLAKLGAPSRAAAVAIGLRRGLI